MHRCGGFTAIVKNGEQIIQMVEEGKPDYSEHSASKETGCPIVSSVKALTPDRVSNCIT